MSLSSRTCPRAGFRILLDRAVVLLVGGGRHPGLSVSQPAIEQLSYTERVLSDLSVADLQDELGQCLLRARFPPVKFLLTCWTRPLASRPGSDAELPAVVVELLQGARHAPPSDVALLLHSRS